MPACRVGPKRRRAASAHVHPWNPLRSWGNKDCGDSSRLINSISHLPGMKLGPVVKPKRQPSRAAARRLSRLPRIPDHELIQQIGAGAYGEVWLARNVIG